LLSIVVILFWWALGFIPMLQTVVSPIAFVALAAVTVWICASYQFLWMFVPENQVFLLDRGKGNYYKTVGLIVDASHWISRFGIHWIGLPPVEVHKFPFKHERVNKNLGPDSKSEEWIETDSSPVETDHLLKKVIHWVKVPGVEFKGGQRADLLFKYEAELDGTEMDNGEPRGPYTAVYIREGKFYDALNSIINSTVISDSVLSQMSYSEEFMGADKDEKSPLCKQIEKTVNETAGPASGYRLIEETLAVIRFDASSTEEAELARLKATSKIEAAAAKLRAKGKVADVTEMIRMIRRLLPNADETTIMQEVTKLGVAERYAGSNLQAVGGGVAVGLEPGKKARKKK
jgi:hypothetical protein